MHRHKFGGFWTKDKLDRLRDYLAAYTRLFQGNPKARKLTRIYVDAFAGTGYRVPRLPVSEKLPLFPELLEPETQAFLKGSAPIALEIEPGFHRYLFIERDKERAKELEALKKQFPNRASSIEIVPEEANQYLKKWCETTDWRYTRAVVFLDPYGMQVDWALIDAIARTKAIDLWILFPLGVAVIRLLTRSQPPRDEWNRALTRILGTSEWEDAFYPEQRTHTLFGEEKVRQRATDLNAVGRFFAQRLAGVFAGVANNPLPLYNSKNVPLYVLCFAVGNPVGVKPALKIAQHILGR